jgi:hypothetical protein
MANNSLDLTQFNQFIQQASESIMCNSECRKEKEAEKLKQNYLNAQINSDSASNQVQVAQKNYVTFTEGEYAYNELHENQLQEKAEVIVDNFNETFNNETTKIKNQIIAYNGLFLNYTNIFDLLTKYKKENKLLYNELKEDTNDVLTNERKTFYEDQQIDKLKFFYFYFLLTIYLICIICFGYFSLFFPSTLNLKNKVFVFVCLIALPFFSSWILGKIIFFAHEIYELIPKNVYK